MGRFAVNTTVSIERSKVEIESILTRYGAGQFGYATDNDRGIATVQFSAKGRHVRFTLRLPSKKDRKFQFSPAGRVRLTPEKQVEAWEQACRQRWRALALYVKAKLEAVESGITEFEDEFLAHIVLPGGGLVATLMKPQIEKAYEQGTVPPGIAGLLPAYEPTGDDD